MTGEPQGSPSLCSQFGVKKNVLATLTVVDGYHSFNLSFDTEQYQILGNQRKFSFLDGSQTPDTCQNRYNSPNEID